MDSLQKCKPPDHTTRKRNLFALQKEYCAPGTQTRIVDIDNRFCRDIEKSFVQANVTQTLCIWTIHVTNEDNSAIVIPTTRGECATHCNCSQKFHTLRQYSIDFCKDCTLRSGVYYDDVMSYDKAENRPDQVLKKVIESGG